MSQSAFGETQDDDNGYEEMFARIFDSLQYSHEMRTRFFEVFKWYMENIVKVRLCIKKCGEDVATEHFSYFPNFMKCFPPKRPSNCQGPSLKKLLFILLQAMKYLPQQLAYPVMPDAVEWDRYRSDFIEIESLGEGGFGTVFKACHKLDGKCYAIKKVPVSLSLDCYESLLREVKVLSELNHPNVAQYFFSWVQMEEGTSSMSSSSEMSAKDSSLASSSAVSSSSSPESSVIIFEDSSRSELFQVDDSENKITSPKDARPVAVSNNQLEWRPTTESSNRKKTWKTKSFESSSNSSNSCLVPYYVFPRRLPKVPTLFIQMELGRESLKAWIRRRNDLFDAKECSWTNEELQQHFIIFREILLVLKYIHSKGILHRDIKPANILLTFDNRILLADFGLAKLVEENDFSKRSPSCVGTPTYCAPEIGNDNYDSKVDIYSLGIILLELLQTFSSDYEKSKTIEAVKYERKLDGWLTKGKWKYFSRLVLDMTEPDPQARPSAVEVICDMENLNSNGRYTRSNSAPSIIQPHSPLINRKDDFIQIRKSLKRSRTLSNTYSPSPKSSPENTRGKDSRKLLKKIVTKVTSELSQQKDTEIRKLKSKIKNLENRIEELERR